jgi:hypothetical protein
MDLMTMAIDDLLFSSADWSMNGGANKPEVNSKPPPDAKVSGASVAARRALK